ncbi:MAG: amphi-Trp domain-containing protein [Candidatus Rokubacteria bacterium]|nr:amphi-Trp domain-containing protein [Candidatus Rokubacteria bacterium]
MRFTGRARRDMAAFYLSELARGVLSGELEVQKGGHGSVVATTEFLFLDIEVREKLREHHVGMKLRWPKPPVSRDPRREEKGMGDKKAFEFEGGATPSEAAEILTRIAEGLRAKSLAVSMGEEGLTVFPDGELLLEIEASERKDKAKMEISIAWKQPPAGDEA